MVQRVDTFSIVSYNSGKPVAKMILQVSTTAELPTLNSEIDGALVAAGSYAILIQAGKIATLDANGTWYYMGGGGAVS